MNCLEVRALVEDELDRSLVGARKRALELHLSRCSICQAFFEAEREEHRRWFQAMNAPEARHRLPEGFEAQFISDVMRHRIQPMRRWNTFCLLRKVAAMLAAMLLFAGLSYAVVIGTLRLADEGSDSNEHEQMLCSDEPTDKPTQSDGAMERQNMETAASNPVETDEKVLPATIPVAPEMKTSMKTEKATAAFVTALAASAFAYNPFAPHANAEQTDFWDTTGYDVTPPSSSSGVCQTAFYHLSRTEAPSLNEVTAFRRIRPCGICIKFR